MADIFISYARKDHFFVDRLREDLQRNGIHYWIDHEGLSPGTASWEKAIRKALKACKAVLWVVSPSSFQSAYVRDEISIARLYKLKIYPIFAEGENWLECVPLGTGEIQYIDARSDYSVALTSIIEALGASKSDYQIPEPKTPTLPAGKEPRNPYKGLVAFTEDDTDDFYGREALIDKLKGRITQKLDAQADRFLAVMGPSGAGKSSVVMAGVIPALRKAHPDWTFLSKIVPSLHPIESLADALYRAMPDKSLSALESDLNSAGGRMLHRLAQQLTGEQVVLYIDQFEELFTLTADEDERQQFINLIAQAVTEPDGKVIVIISMRADFYGHPMNYPQLGALVNQNNEAVLPMSITELRDAIEKPARLPDVALTFADGLVAEIIFALRERDKALAGALPLLQFTLERIFEEREGTHLTWEAYNTLGDPERGISGVEGAIGTHCEAVFSQLPATAQDKLGQVFLPLVSIDEVTGEATRRRAELDALMSDDDAKTLVDSLIKNRLFQTGEDGKTAYLEIAHEALFRSWERLVTWIESARDDLTTINRMKREAQTWHEKREPEYLLPNAETLQEFTNACTRLGMIVDDPILQNFTEPEQERLYRELEIIETSHERRRDIGDRLAVIGDTRRGVGVKDGLPDILWLPVKGSNGKIVEFTGDRGKFGEFEVPDFFIAKYLVTYTQYQTFVESDYKNIKWWEGFPKRYQPQKLKDVRTKIVNAPRDSISWYQSVAFSRWLDTRLREANLLPDDMMQIRMPREWEWQWVAQNGAKAWNYPWGDWQEGYANTSEAGLSRTTSVGMYPHATAKHGVLDISSNLYEWCLNDYNTPTMVHVIDDSEVKVLRGGSFYLNQNNAKSTYRGSSAPNYSGNYYGCRLVVAPRLEGV